MKNTGKEFIELTKYQFLDQSDQSKGLPQPPLEADYDLTKQRIALPDPKVLKLGQMPLIDVIAQRRSLRQYSPEPITMEELSYLLWCTQGVQKIRANTATLRNVPSAGARHAFETYLLINRVNGLEPGLYRYLALEHKLIGVNTEPDIAEKIVAGCLGQGFAAQSAVTFVWVAVVSRMTWRYVERGYRYLHLDAGHVCQNLYLAAESINCGACALAAFDDDVINDVLGLDGEEQFVIYVSPTGKRP